MQPKSQLSSIEFENIQGKRNLILLPETYLNTEQKKNLPNTLANVSSKKKLNGPLN